MGRLVWQDESVEPTTSTRDPVDTAVTTLDEGGFVRLSGDYELAEAQILTIGVIFYDNGDAPPVFDIGDNDRVFAGYSYSF